MSDLVFFIMMNLVIFSVSALVIKGLGDGAFKALENEKYRQNWDNYDV